MELTLSFDGKDMKTMVYIKMDAADQLLLSEGVCRQLGIVIYHPSIRDWKGGRQKKLGGGRKRARAPKSKAQAPTVRIRTTRVPPSHTAVVPVQVESDVPNRRYQLKSSHRSGRALSEEGVM